MISKRSDGQPRTAATCRCNLPSSGRQKGAWLEFGQPRVMARFLALTLFPYLLAVTTAGQWSTPVLEENRCEQELSLFAEEPREPSLRNQGGASERPWGQSRIFA